MSDDTRVSPEVEESLARHRRGGADTSGTLVLSQPEGYVGDTITLQGRNFPGDSAYEVVWHSTQGSWGVLEGNKIIGPQYSPASQTVGTVRTDDSGAFDEPLTIPEDYGGSHRIEIVDGDDAVADAEFDVTPWFELDRTTAPLGEAFTITGYGIGPGMLQNNYQVAWDNGTVGFVTGVQNNGTATAQIRAAPPVGNHTIQIWRNHRGVPFLQNNTQSPYGPVAGGRQSVWTVEVTEPESPPPAAWMDQQLDERPMAVHYPDLDEETAASLSITPECGQAGTEATITGADFPAHTEVDLVWHRHEGHRVKGVPITPEPKPDALPTVSTDGDGQFAVDVTVPTDVGSTRPITAEIDGRSVAVTGFMMQPSVETFEPTSGPVGTEITIELAGVGWTEYENAPYFVYDNHPVGYVCGVDDEDADGISRTILRASGAPGYHFIDVYPALFRMEDEEPNFEIMPHLSYIDNHPVRPLPAWHFAFEVTE
jgi:hypothetical protein